MLLDTTFVWCRGDHPLSILEGESSPNVGTKFLDWGLMSSGRTRLDQKPADRPEIKPDPRVTPKTVPAKGFCPLEARTFRAKTL